MNLPETVPGWLALIALIVLMGICGVLAMLGLSALMDKLEGCNGGDE
jgi:hypothetical protein